MREKLLDDFRHELQDYNRQIYDIIIESEALDANNDCLENELEKLSKIHNVVHDFIFNSRLEPIHISLHKYRDYMKWVLQEGDVDMTSKVTPV